MGVGIDIVQIERIKLEDNFIDLILSRKEKEIYHTKVNKKEYIASRFAVKEAFLKAKGVGLGQIRFKEIEVLNYESGKPYICFEQTIYENVSLSHEKDYAVAIVII